MRLLLIAIAVCGICFGVSAQTLTTNADGEQIIVYPDGSWRYFNQPPGETPPPLDPGSVEDEQYNNPEINAEAEARARAITRKKAEAQLKVVADLNKQLARQRNREEKELTKLAKLRKSAATVDRDKLEVATRKLQDERRKTQEIRQAFEEAKHQADILEKAIPMTRSGRQQYFADNNLSDSNSPNLLPQPEVAEVDPGFHEESNEDPGTSESISTHQEDQESVQSESEIAITSPVKTQVVYAEYDLQKDPRYAPPSQACVFTYEGVDEFTQKVRKTVAPEVFFSFTSPELKRYLGKEDLITAVGSLTKSGGTLIFDVTYTIRSQFANREFGVLPKGSQMTLKMVGSSTVTLRNQSLAQGTYDPVEKVYTYTARYPISSRQEKTLDKELVDQVRVMWGTGFEDYPIFEVNFFQRQLRCL